MMRIFAQFTPSASPSSKKTSNSRDDCEQRGVHQSEAVWLEGGIGKDTHAQYGGLQGLVREELVASSPSQT